MAASLRLVCRRFVIRNNFRSVAALHSSVRNFATPDKVTHTGQVTSVVLVFSVERDSLRKADVSPRSPSLRHVSWGGTSATQRRKFGTDDVNQCLHNKSGSHGVPNVNFSNFTFLLVDFGKVLCSSVNELQQNSNASSREDYIPQILTVLLEILRVYMYIWPLWPFVFCLSFVNNS